MTKKIAPIALWGMLFLVSPLAYAHGADGDMAEGHGYGMLRHGHEWSGCPVAGKLMKKIHTLLENETELNLTADQVKAIKELKLGAEKDMIRQKADGEIFRLDLNSKLEADKVDVDGAQALIDKNFASLNSASKSNLEAYARVKKLLTPEQLAKMKELWKNKKEEYRKAKAE